MWLGFAAFAMHMASLMGALVVVAGTRPAQINAGQPGGTTAALSLPTVESVLIAGTAATAVLWVVLGLSLVAAGFSIRSARHRLACQVAVVLTIPLGVIAVVQMLAALPCGVLGTAFGIVLHVALATLGGWLAYRLGTPAARAAFQAGEEPVA